MFIAPSLWQRWALGAALAFTASLIATDVTAHARWSPDGATPGRNNNANIKVGPCGVARTNTPAVFKAGETITLQWESTIHHQGYFRIAFSPAGDAGFDQNVLLDNVQEFDNRYTGEYSAQVTLPSEPCDDCSLQMIQVMLDRSPPTNYYSCADIQLVADAASDLVPPLSVSNLGEAQGLPNLRLRWVNPAEDFAGVLVLHGNNGGEPQIGTSYQLGDVIGSATVAYVGAGQAVNLPAANAGDTLRAFAFDMARNYSAPVSHQVLPALPAAAPVVSLAYEQLGQPGSGLYSADGEIVLQAAVLVSDANGDITMQWSVDRPAGLPLDVLAGAQATLDPAGYGGQDFSITVKVTDSASPPNVVQESISASIAPYSFYLPSFVLMQQGKVVSQVDANNGPAEIRTVFEGEAPSDLERWNVSWAHDIPNAQEGPLALTFTPTVSASYRVSAQIYSPTAEAGAEDVIAVTVKKPVKLGAFGGLTGGGLPLLLLVRLWFRRRVRLQGAA